ncbi:MAG: putative site-specific integrase-resolvase [Peptococcaceae bacterium]|jgi:excisionase family DNA binding protein|nr:putative site-specific integrase-resolvase [Peptococcaceae bacterium]
MEKMLTSHQAAKLLNVWPHTLRRWEREGKLKPLRTPGGHRRYKELQIMALIGEEITVIESEVAAGENDSDGSNP